MYPFSSLSWSNMLQDGYKRKKIEGKSFCFILFEIVSIFFFPFEFWREKYNECAFCLSFIVLRKILSLLHLFNRTS